MSLKEFQILLDSPVYYTGQEITGKLLLQLTKAKQVKEIRIIYSGSGTVKWKHGRKEKKTEYEHMEKFLDLEQRIFGNGKDECELVAGRHVFAFYCQLPSNLPSSYKGKFGRIKYTVQAKMDWSWRSNYNVEQPITILSVFDLNCLPIAASPVSEKKSKKVRKWSQMLHMSCDLPVRGFVPGQIIPITVTLSNESMVQVKNITATLYQNVIYRVHSAVNRSKVRLSKTQLAVDKGFGFHKALVSVQVPALPPSYLEFCNFIDFRYHLIVEAEIDTVCKNLKFDTEVLIGNIPLMMYQKPITVPQPFPEIVDSENPSQSQSSAEEPQLSTHSFPQLAMYGNFALPRYEQIVEVTPPKESNPDLVYPVYQFATTEA